MSQADLLTKVRRIPFQPFEVVLTTGETFPVRHPDLIMVGRRSLVVGVASDPSKREYDLSYTIDLIHVVGTKELASAAADATNNGAP